MGLINLVLSMSIAEGAMSSELSYISNRMDEILRAMITNPVYKTLLDVFSQIGVLLMSAYFLVDLLEKASDLQFDGEILFKQSLKYVIGFAFINHVSDISNGLCDFSFACVNLLNSAATSLSATDNWGAMMQTINSAAQQLSPTAAIGANSGGVFKNIIMILIIRVVLQFATWKLSIERAFKIGYKTILAPIVCADCITNGLNSVGVKHIKEIFALYMQTVVIMAAMTVLNIVCLQNVDVGFWGCLITIFLLKDTIKQSESLASEIVGM